MVSDSFDAVRCDDGIADLRINRQLFQTLSLKESDPNVVKVVMVIGVKLVFHVSKSSTIINIYIVSK